MASSLSYSGFCTDCRKMHSLPPDRAIPYARELIRNLEIHRCLDFELPESERNPELSTARLYSDMRGKMFGVLVCEDAKGNEIVLKAFSSKYNNYFSAPGWAPLVPDETAFTTEIENGNKVLHPMTDTINALVKDHPDRKQLIDERRAASHAILERLLDMYNFTNFRGETRNIRQAFTGKRIPMGTGDCCAPKLLNYAAKNGLRPIALVEFFWGKETVSGDRQQGEFYEACAERCQPLLGFMLCGCEFSNA